MADSLVNGHERPRLDGSASCPSYYSLGMRRKEAGLAARLPVQIYCNRCDYIKTGLSDRYNAIEVYVVCGTKVSRLFYIWNVSY